jgi:DNA repair protein RecO
VVGPAGGDAGALWHCEIVVCLCRAARVCSAVPIEFDEAVCIRHWDWSETSQTLSLFSRGHGVIRGVAKGAKREKSDFSGGFELATRGEVGVIIKTSGAMATLTSWELLESFPALRRSLKAHQSAMAMLELVGAAFREGEPHARAFEALVAGLRGLDPDGDWRTACARLVWIVLAEAGYQPEVSRDARAGGVLTDRAVYEFSPSLGGLTENFRSTAGGASAAAVLNAGAGGGVGGPIGGAAWKVRKATVEFLRRLRDACDRGEELAAGVTPEELVTRERALALLGAYARECLQAPLPAFQMLISRAESAGSA